MLTIGDRTMSDHDLEVFEVALEPSKMSDDDWKEFNEKMNKVQDSINDYISNLAEKLGVSNRCAGDVYYLRTRSRWTQDLEDKLIKLHKEGNPPDSMCDFPCSEE